MMKYKANWLCTLTQLEDAKQWDEAIEFLVTFIKHKPENKHAYMSLLYLLFNLWLEEPHDRTKDPYYQKLMDEYFKASHERFQNEADYLFYFGTIVSVAEWFFNADRQLAFAMIKKAKQLDPDNLVFKWYCFHFDFRKGPNSIISNEVQAYARSVFQKDSPICKELEPRGFVGYYFLERMEYTSERIFEHLAKQQVRSGEVTKNPQEKTE